MLKIFSKVSLVALLLLFAACSSGGSDDVTAIGADAGSETGTPTGTGTSPDTATGAGNLRVSLTDKPAEEYQAVKVTVASVRVHQSAEAGEADGSWLEIPVTAAMPVDLLTLRNGVLYELCGTTLSAGHYQQIRLALTANEGTTPPYRNSVVTADGTEHALEAQSGTIKIVHQFTIAAGTETDLVLDFDASQSVKKRGNGTFFMQPVIKASSASTEL